jgi:hypothetical protein
MMNQAPNSSQTHVQSGTICVEDIILVEICPGIFGFEIRDTGFPGIMWSGKQENPGIQGYRRKFRDELQPGVLRGK